MVADWPKLLGQLDFTAATSHLGRMSADNLPDRIEPELRPPPRPLAPAVDAGFVTTPEPRHPLMAGWQPAPPPPAAQGFSPPVFGALSVIFGIAAFYKASLMLGPLAIVAGLIACLRKQWGWGLVGMLSAVAAMAVDPYVWALGGLYWLAKLLGLVG
jgi:hypothetical protein